LDSHYFLVRIGFTLKVGSSNRIRVITNGATQLQNKYLLQHNKVPFPSLEPGISTLAHDSLSSLGV
jgi:hypothetical protein